MGAESIRFTRTWAQWGWVVGTLAVVVAGTQLAFAVTNATLPTSFEQRVGFAAMFVLPFAGVTAVLYRWQGVTLSPEALTVRSLGSRAIAWRDISDISVERELGGTVVVVLETSGRRTRLPAPHHRPLRLGPGLRGQVPNHR